MTLSPLGSTLYVKMLMEKELGNTEITNENKIKVRNNALIAKKYKNMSEKKTYRFQTIVVEDSLRAEYSELRETLGTTDKQLFTAIWELIDHDALAEKVAEMQEAAKLERETKKLQKDEEKLQKKVAEQQKKLAANAAILNGAEESAEEADDADFELDELEDEAPTVVIGA